MSADSGGWFATLTHARLRLSQGDFDGAARVLRVIVDTRPTDKEALRMLAEVEDRVAVAHKEPSDEKVEDVTPDTARGLARKFRNALDSRRTSESIDRLRVWLERSRRNRRTIHAG